MGEPECLSGLFGRGEGLALGVVAENTRVDEAAEGETAAGVCAEEGECGEH